MSQINSQVDNFRLDRIERKIDKLADAVISLARAEEKLVSLEKEQNVVIFKVNSLEKKVDETEKSLLKVDSSVKFASKIFWFVLSAVITSGVGLWFTVK